ncbi:MAG: hypothetical protein Q8Q41_00705 [bacterium]|nr:hypothetical protein [bacterium]
MSTNSLVQFLRARRTTLLITVVAFLFGSASFLAGYLTALEYQPTPIVIEKCASIL